MSIKMSSLKSYGVPFLAFLIIAGAIFGFFSAIFRNVGSDSFLNSGKSVSLVTAISDLNFPNTYNKPLSLLNNTFSIRPLKAEAAQAIFEADKKTVRYVNAYANTDVVQTKYSNKIKEDIILKQPGHPGEFSYEVNMSNYDFKKDQGGNFVFYPKGKNDSELDRVFTIPAPFMIDADGKKSLITDVDSTLTADGKLVIKPSQSWLENSKYPVILDPTIEINIINVHSHPDQGDNWTVNFTTQGSADLKIIPVDQATIDDDEFVSLSCGNNKVSPQILTGDVIYYPNWSCSETATVIHYTKVAGKHTLRFEFGDQIAYAYNTSSEIIFRAPSPCNPAPVTGGTITYTDSNGANPRSSPAYSGGYTVHTFTASGSMVITNSGNVSVLVVAGGGGGGSDITYGGGGGGAGGVIYNSSLAVTAQTYSVTVGNGGASDTNGGDSVFSSVTATGGGKGAGYNVTAGSGGSGGGAGYLGTAGTGTTGQGNNGGTGASAAAGGGGGKGAAGSNASLSTGGAGGTGSSYSISGTTTYYGGGGGGAGSGTGGAGGTGGGGAGASVAGVGTSGTANTGGGGGGAIGGDIWAGANAGGAGGSGIVIVRYLTSDFTCATQNANIVFRSTGVVPPTGGTITYTDSNGANPRSSPAYSGGYTVHTFTTTGNSTFKVTKSGNVSVLAVAGGGGGATVGQYIGGGGGAGGVVYNSSFAVTAQTYTVTVGNGGTVGNNGENSVFSTITATGGGKGGADSGAAGSGGSGGGAGYSGTPGTGSSGQGNDGGTGGGGVLYGASGGGGGAGAVGNNGVDNGNSTSQSGAGGIGVSNSISGTTTYYGGGGGGGANWGLAGAGGTGGGGAGGKGATATNGSPNTGGGGGGAGGYYYYGGSGGSGIVIIRYLTSDFAADPDPVILK